MKLSRKKLISLFAAGAVCASAFPVFASVSFDNLDLNDGDCLLYTENHNIPGSPSYKSLFQVNLGDENIKDVPKLLTCYPERLELLNEGKILQIRNRFGEARYDTSSSKLEWTETSSSIPLDNIRIGATSVSPDGKWFCYVKKTNNAIGKLILENALNGEEFVLSEKSPFDYEKVSVKWSKDGSVLLYEKNGNIYFINPASAGKSMALSEEYRVIGKGNINCVNWTPQSIIYIDGDVVYKIPQNELYTRGLYSSLIGSSNLVSRLSEGFDMLHDCFWVNSLENEVVIVKNSKILSWYSFSAVTYGYASLKGIYSLTGLKGNPFDFMVFWNLDRKPIVWMDMLNYETGKKSSGVFSLAEKLEPLLDVKGAGTPSLSPDGRYIAFAGGNTLYVYDNKSWECKAKFTGEKIVSFLWTSSSSLVAGGEEKVSLCEFDVMKTGATSRRTLFLSSVEKAWWDSGRIVAEGVDTKTVYAYDSVKNTWKESSSVQEGSSESNSHFRVFLGRSQNAFFENTIFVRSLSSSVKTYPIYAESGKTVTARKRVALVFDAVDSADGLSTLLYTLEQWNIQAVFFINGEFMKRYPLETKQILASGHECASGFYTKADLTLKNFRIDEDFIKRGLARNEDEFFQVTGNELSLLWHAPEYKVSDSMKKYGESAGYVYVDAFTEINSNITYEESVAMEVEYLDSASLIDAYVSCLKDGLVIPIKVGKTEGSRNDYLYEKLDLLISAILDNGGEIVNVRSILEK